MREGLFNVLAARLDFAGLAVLDLYAGSGALGLEALSRGAACALFVEADHRAAGVVARNISELGVRNAAVRRASVATVLAAGAERPAGLVLADPPYDLDAAEIGAMLVALADGGWVAAGSVMVIERRASGPPTEWPPGWSAWPVRRYGDTRLDIADRN